LVILDEIDGADATGSINSIVRVSLKSLSLFEI
jgi:hypothetical protein